jgi:hypothetical protein
MRKLWIIAERLTLIDYAALSWALLMLIIMLVVA